MAENIQKIVLERVEAQSEETIDFLKQLIAFPSVTGNEKDIQLFISDRLRLMGLTVDMWEPSLEELRRHPAYVPTSMDYKDRPNLVGVYRGEGGGRSLILNGHVDVIPPGPSEAWNYKPWGGEIERGRIYGRGSSDMKSGLAAMTMALKAIMDAGVKLRGDVILEYTVDEELSGNGTLACILRGYRADAGVCCESSSLKVQPACIGRIWFEIFIRGKPAGIQRRWEGVNAIEKGWRIAEAISRLEEIRVGELSHPLYPDPREALPCLVGMFEAGSYPSSFPDTCVLRGSIATLPSEDSDAVKRQFQDFVMQVAQTDPWLRKNAPEVRFKGYFAEPSEIPPDHPIVKTLSKNLQRVTGREPALSGRLGATDARLLNKYGETPTVIFGPGLTEQMHATNEHVNVADLINATKVLALSILDWCGHASAV